MRKVLAVGLALAFIVAVPTAVMAASGVFSSSLDLQTSKWSTTTATTSSTTFKTIPALASPTICALNQVTATLSVELNGAPAGFQIRVDGVQPGRCPRFLLIHVRHEREPLREQ